MAEHHERRLEGRQTVETEAGERLTVLLYMENVVRNGARLPTGHTLELEDGTPVTMTGDGLYVTQGGVQLRAVTAY